jgi:heterodisulfide reductase subunit A-like polyferredoxin
MEVPMNTNLKNMISQKWDYIIIGTGIGGSSFGLKMAQAGKKVLFLEKGVLPTIKGQFAEQHSDFQSQTNEVLKQAGRCHVNIQDISNQKLRNYIPFIGSGVGEVPNFTGWSLKDFQKVNFSLHRNPGHFHIKICNTIISRLKSCFT